MDNFIKWFKEVMYFTLPGFIYLISAFIFCEDFLSHCLNIELNVLFENNVLLLVVIVLISYIIGLSMQYVLQGILWQIPKKDFFKEYKENLTKDLVKLKEAKKIIYSTMIMYRHLIISFIILCASILLQKGLNKGCYTKNIITLLIICITVLLIAYFLYLRKAYNEMKNVN